MSTEFFVFADRREPVGGDAPLHGERPGDSVQMMQFIQLNDWQYPVYVIFREHGDQRWSFAYLRPRKGDPEDDEGH